VVGRSSFALERFASPRHRSHVAQLFSLGSMNTPKTMNTLIIRKWEGVSSVVWALLGFGPFQYWVGHHGFHSQIPAFLSVFVLWWGVSLLLAISGLRSRSRVGVIAGSVTLLGFLCFLLVIFHG
jgi:hypothetical protein